MLKKILSKKFIIVFSVIVSIAGIINNLLPSTNQQLILFKQIVDPLSLGWAFSQDLYFRFNGHNYVNLLFDVLLLTGVIVFALSKNKPSSLIRFFFSIVIFSNVLGLVYSIFLLLVSSKALHTLHDTFIDLVFYTFEAFWVGSSWMIIRSLTIGKVFENEIKDDHDNPQVVFYKATQEQRFLHPLIDTVLTIMLFSPFIAAYYLKHTPSFFGYVSSSFIMSLLIPLRIIYYLFYETLLGVTPAKYITQTRVVDFYGEKPGFKAVVMRTFSRLVPFEAFSFFVDDGWHDKWSQTVVARETNVTKEEEDLHHHNISKD